MSPWRASKSISAVAAGALALALATVSIPAAQAATSSHAAASGYLNLHQCVYHGGNASDRYTNVMPNTGNTSFNTGTKVSSTADSQVACGSGASGWTLEPVNSSVFSVALG